MSRILNRSHLIAAACGLSLGAFAPVLVNAQEAETEIETEGAAAQAQQDQALQQQAQQPQQQQQLQQPQQDPLGGQQAQLGGQQGQQQGAMLGAQGQQAQGVQMQQGQVAGLAPTTTWVQATVQGVVTGLDYSRGLIQVNSGNQNTVLRIRPMDLAPINPGDVVALSYANFNGQLWVTPQQSGIGLTGYGAPQTFAQYGTVTGTIANVDKATGLMQIRGQTFRIHPIQLQQVIPGQFVTVSFENVNGANWIASINPALTYGGQQQQQGGGF